jgi:hypothetical protein
MVDLKGMSRKKKAEYIWEYYRIHIICAIAIIFIVGSIINSQITKIDYVFNLTMFGSAVDENKSTELEKQLTKLVVKDGEERKEATVANIPLDGSSSDNASISSQYMQKFIAQVSIGELDLLVLDKVMFESLVKQDIFMKLDNISQLDLNSIKNEKIEASGSDSNMDVYAINVQDNKMFKDMGYDTQSKVIGIVSTSKQKDTAIFILKWLVNGK